MYTLTKDQVAGFHAITTYRKKILLIGTAGTGKTDLLKLSSIYFQQHNKNVCKLGYTNRAARSIQGETIHSWFDLGNIPENLNEFLHMLERQHYYFTQKEKHKNDFEEYTIPHSKVFSCEVPTYNTRKYTKSDSVYNRVLKNIDILIISEIYMLPLYLFDHLDVAFRIGRKINKPFGDVQIIVEGDPFQSAPIQLPYAYNSKNWNEALECTLELTQVVRQQSSLLIGIIERFKLATHTKEDLRYLHETCLRPVPDPKSIPHLFPTLAQVRSHNERMFRSLADDNKDKVQLPRHWEKQLVNSDDQDIFLEPILDKQLLRRHELDETIFGNPKQKIKLPPRGDKMRNILELKYLQCYFDNQIKTPLEIKKGCRVKLITNKIEGLTSGILGTVKSWFELGNELQVVVTFDNGRETAIEMEETVLTHDDYKYIRLKRYPFTLAFALTISEVQGLSLPKVAMNLGDRIFLGGQIYCALSRALSIEHLYLLEPINKDKIFPPLGIIEYYDTINNRITDIQLQRWSNMDVRSKFLDLSSASLFFLYKQETFKKDVQNNNNNEIKENEDVILPSKSFLKKTGQVRMITFQNDNIKRKDNNNNNDDESNKKQCI